MPRPVAVQAVADDEKSAALPGRIVMVDYEGHTYTYDLDAVEVGALEDWDDGKHIRAVRSILGRDQWAAYKERHPKYVDLDGFLAALLKAAAASGNSSASSAS
jgi:hypothetical protein